jgi:hypothetical protein
MCIMKLMRRRKNKNNKNFFPALFISFFLWATLAALVYFIDPATKFAVPAFLLLIFIALFMTLSLTLANSRRGLLVAGATTFFFILRIGGIGHLLNFLLLAGIVITIDLGCYSK